ncbi:protein IWS1 homolog isoform X3 [Parambassis ranga]|uniref:Protein IWS1 homolog isoform X3 n=1 Tax=Parambassis ranga TaxID=210632 RepID=A0A6P7KIU1_9TELE|nr:protein IWS1 homolog isoform X3 [Parambassis ranga]
MDTKYPVLRRPKRKLCYVTNKRSPSKRWEGPMTLEDVDKMFDDLDSTPQYDVLPPSPLLQTSDTEGKLNEEEEASPALLEEEVPEHQTTPEADVQCSPMRSPSPKLDLDIPFKAHTPVKTSSPVERNRGEEAEERLNNGNDIVMSPILFPQEDEGKKSEPIQGTLDNESQEDSDGQSKSESPSSSVPVIATSHKEKLEKSCRKENLVPPVPAVWQQTEVAAPERNSENINSEPHVESVTCGGKNINDFLQKIKHLIQSKPALSKKSPVKAPTSTPPEPEDDFLILEDDASYTFTIPTKTTTSKRQSKTSSSDSSTDKVEKDCPVEGPEKQQASKKPNSKLRSQSVNQKAKKMRSEAPGPENEKDTSLSLQDRPMGDLKERGKPSKKRWLKKAQSKKSDKEQDLPKDRERRQMETNAHKSKMSESSNDEEPTKTKRKKELQGSDAVKEMTHVDDILEQNHEQTDVVDPCSLTDGMSEQNQPPGDSEENSSEVSQIHGKRKRKQTGLWWLSCPQSTEETDNHQPTLKKSKENNKKPNTAETSPIKAKGKVFKKRNHNEPVHTNKATEKRRRQNKKTRGDMLDKMKTTEQEQQDTPDQEQLRDNCLNLDRNILTPDTDGTSERNKQAVNSEESSSEACQLPRMRKKTQAGQQGLKCPQHTEETDKQQATFKKSKQNNRKPSAAETSPVPNAKKDTLMRTVNRKRSASTNKATKKERKQNKNTRQDASDEIKTTGEVFKLSEELEQQDIPDQDLNQEHSSPLVFTHKDSSLNTGAQIFQRVYQPKEQVRNARPGKRRRKPPGNWWLINSMDEDLESVSSQPQQLHHKESKRQREKKKHSKQRKSFSSDGDAAVSSAPQGGAPVPPLKQTELSTPKMSKRDRPDVFTSQNVVNSGQKNRYGITSHPAEECSAEDHTRRRTETSILCMDVGEIRSTQNSPSNPNPPQNRGHQLENTFEVLKSGPSSMIELEEGDDRSDEMILPSTRVHTALSVSDLCAPPLRPLILQPKDKANLTEWFKILWPSTADSVAEITPDQFEWYFYQDRAMGFQVDLNSGSICNGKILLGSHMKKPLWVDHSATTVFNLLTSSVRVAIDGSESRYSPGQSFVVQCGQAYSLQNVTAQPAVLYFTRILAESLD